MTLRVIELPVCFQVPGIPVNKGQASRLSIGRAMQLHRRWELWRNSAGFHVRKQLEPLPWMPAWDGSAYRLMLTEPHPGPVIVDVQWWQPDRRARDWDNCVYKPLGDLLTACGILTDDHSGVLTWGESQVMDTDKIHPRLGVEIRDDER